jgi:hypothetical protein
VLAEVVRAHVSAIDRARGLRYRAAFDFATRIVVPSEPDLLQGALRILA